MDRTNVTSSGYTFNGQNFTNETRTDSQGNNYTVAVPSTISTATLSAPTTLPVTQPQYNTSGQQSLASQAGAYVNTATTAAEQALQAEQDALKASQTDVGRLLTDAGNKGTDIASQYNQQDATGQSVNSLAAKLRQLSARSNALSIDNLAKSQGEINKATGQNITQSAVTRNTADATRENLINQASIAMESAIVNADYQSAKSYADQMVDAKYDKLEANTKAALFNLENNKERFTAAEKKVAEATTARLLKEQRKYEEDKANEKDVAKLIIDASPVAPPDVLARAKAIQDRGGSATEVATALGVYGGDYLARQKIKAEIKKIEGETAKIRAESVGSSTGGVTGTASTNAKSWLAQYNSGALSLEDIYTKIGSTKEALALKNEVSNLVASQGGKRVYGADDASIQAINAQIKNVNDLLNGGVGKVVGVIQGGAGVFPDRLNVGKQDALAIAKNLVSNQTLQALADAKSKGITFGALSEGELGLVADSASRIAAKLKTDEAGNIVGFTGSEKQFKADLQAIKTGLEKSITGKTQTTSQEDSVADDIMKANSSVRAQIGSTYNIFDK